MRFFFLLWITGLLTAVPYSVYYLFFHADTSQYAALIVFPLFWIFGYWGVVTPAYGAWRIHRLMRSLEHVRSHEELVAAIQRHDTREQVVELIAREGRMPLFLARMVYERVVAKVQERSDAPILEPAPRNPKAPPAP